MVDPRTCEPSYAVAAVRSRALAFLRPAPRLKLSEWIESEMRLPEGVTALPGRVRLWEYQRGIADAISDPEVERVTVLKSVRVGLSTLISATVASFVGNEPSPILCLLPTEQDARDFVVSDLEPIFEATPACAGLLSAEADESGRNTLLSRRFPGGSLKVVAAKSPRNLRRHNVRILLMDEIDAMEASAEGNPLSLAERRTLSFANRKIVAGSTPTNDETSNVIRLYAQSDKRVFEVPCPSCGEFNEILWPDIRWAPGEPETAHYVCPHNGCVVEESAKAGMVAKGRWRATAPEVRGHAGFRLNALVSTLANASWSNLAAEFLRAKDHPDQLQTFVNTILGQGWREAAEETDANELASRAERFGLQDPPAEVLIITAGVDVQHDRLEVTYLGHGRDTVFVLAHDVIWGSPGDDATWIELDDALRATWRHPGGGTLRVDAAAIDSGDGAWTARVYDFCRPRLSRKVVAIKGVPGTRLPISRAATKGVHLFLVGVDGLKSQILQRLSRGETIRFSDRLEPHYFEQVASERRVIRYLKGQAVKRFERIPGRRAEGLDCLVYALAVRHLVTKNLDQRGEELSSPAAPVRAPAVVRSAWLAR